MARKALKRGNGEGTLRERSDGRWEAIYTLGYGPDGRLKRKSVYGRTQAEAIAKLDALKQQITSGTYTDNRLRLDAYLDQWLDHKKRNLKPSTHAKYAYCVEHAKNQIGGTPLKKVKPLHIQNAIANIADTAGTPTANNVRRVLHNAFKQALRWQLIARNPVEAVDPLKEEKRQMTLWTVAQAAKFLEHAQVHRLHALFYVAMSTGMRRGELLGLRWSDITGNTIHIRQTLVRAGKELVASTPKTKSGERRIAVADDVLSVLQNHKRRQDAESAEAADIWVGSGLVFADELGDHLEPYTITRALNAIAKTAKIPAMRFHDLRHLHASMCIRNGMDPKTLADRLGHARASFTLDTYTHLFQDRQEAPPVSLNAFLTRKNDRATN